MKVLFITIGTFRNINASGIYTDLLRMFQQKGHEVFVICSSERREEKKNADILRFGGSNFKSKNREYY